MKNHRNLGFIIPPLHYAALAVAQTHVPSVQIQGCRSTRPVTKRESRFVQGEQHNVYLELALIHNLVKVKARPIRDHGIEQSSC